MPAGTDKRRQKREAVRGVLLFGLIQLACTLCIGALCFIPELPRCGFCLFAGLAALCAALILPALMVLKERFQEIEGGELDAAAEY